MSQSGRSLEGGLGVGDGVRELGRRWRGVPGWRNRTAVELVQETLELEQRQNTRLPGE